GGRNYDYTELYVEDKKGEEGKSNARVWNVYLDEGESYDSDMIESFRNIIDGVLLFSALFSAVVTTFVAQTSQSLQPDNAQIMVALLYENNRLLRVAGNSTGIDAVPSAGLIPGSMTHTSTDVWVNGLFFGSLVMSLSVALVTVLVKQWIQAYTSFVSGSAKDRALIRHFRFRGVGTWKLGSIIESLPLMLHASVAIFFIGLALYVSQLSSPIVSLTAVTFMFYFGTSALPALSIDCPYRIPLLFFVAQHLLFVVRMTIWVFQLFWSRICHAPLAKSPSLHGNSLKDSEKSAALPQVSQDTFQKIFPTATKLTCDGLLWVFTDSSNQSVKTVVVQGLAGLLEEWEAFRNPLNSVMTQAFNQSRRKAMSHDLFANTIAFSLQQLSELQAPFGSEEALYQDCRVRLISCMLSADFQTSVTKSIPYLHCDPALQNQIQTGLARAYVTAVLMSNNALAKLLLQWGAIIPYASSTSGLLLLHDVAGRGNSHALGDIIDSGTSVDARDSNGNTALHFAAEAGYLESVKALVAAEASLSINNNNHKTALELAVKNGQADVVAYILDLKGDIHQDNRFRYALHYAARLGYSGLASVLLDRGWGEFSSLRDSHGRTPLECAREYAQAMGESEIVAT
ncbi:hypothetical protein C0991_003523, partial [Blastosporella zonata]